MCRVTQAADTDAVRLDRPGESACTLLHSAAAPYGTLPWHDSYAKDDSLLVSPLVVRQETSIHADGELLLLLLSPPGLRAGAARAL